MFNLFIFLEIYMNDKRVNITNIINDNYIFPNPKKETPQGNARVIFIQIISYYSNNLLFLIIVFVSFMHNLSCFASGCRHQS